MQCIQVRRIPVALVFLTLAKAQVDAYIPLSTDNQVAVVNTVTHTIKTRVPVGKSPFGVATDSVHGVVYITNRQDNTVSVIDGATQTVFQTVKVGADPRGIAVTPDGATVFVANSGSDTVSYFQAFQAPSAATAAPGGGGVILNLVFNIRVGNTPWGIAVTPDGKSVYVSIQSANSVAIIDAKTFATKGTVQVGHGPKGVSSFMEVLNSGVTPAVWVTNSVDNTVSLIDAGTQRVVQTFPVGNSPQQVGAFPFLNGSVFVSNNGGQHLSFIDPTGQAATTLVTVATRPSGVNGTPSGGKLWVVTEGGSIYEVDAVTKKASVVVNTGGGTPRAIGQFFLTRFRTSHTPPIYRPSANLSVSMGTDSATGAPQFVVQNHGPNPSDGVEFQLPIPAGIQFLAARPSQGGCVTPPVNNGGAIRCSLGSLYAGETASVQITTIGGPAQGSANVSSVFATDPSPNDNSVTTALGSVLQVTITPNKVDFLSPPVLSFSTGTSGLVVSNGYMEHAATNVMLTMSLPDDVVVNSAAQSLGCVEHPAGGGQVRYLSCPPQAIAHGGCFWDANAVTCDFQRVSTLATNSSQPNLLDPSAGSTAFGVFPVDLPNAQAALENVTVRAITDTPGATVIPITVAIGEGAFIGNAPKLWPAAFKTPKTSSGCNQALNTGFGALLNVGCGTFTPSQWFGAISGAIAAGLGGGVAAIIIGTIVTAIVAAAPAALI